MEDTIFVQIASYRDTELIPTVKDCISNALRPQNLRFCIGWQHDETESIDELKALLGPKLHIIDMDYRDAKGVCWMRRQIQDQYEGEKYTLQLDSHHRFVKNWDFLLIDMIEDLFDIGVQKPLLTAYLPSYDPTNDPDKRVNEPWQLNFDRFLPEGPIFLRPSVIKDIDKITLPVRARAVSGHFIFTIGKWCNEVKYDHELYFHGEEISLAVRSFTHGYDLFHPHQVIIWHYYTRAGSKRHWDDAKNWEPRNTLSYKRVKIMLGVDGENPDQIDFAERGLGNERTLHDFEIYAGTEFKTRRMRKDSIEEVLPTYLHIPEVEHQANLVYRFKHCLDIYKPDVPENDYEFWVVAFKTKDNVDICRMDISGDEARRLLELEPENKFVHLWREFDYTIRPDKWVVWPYSKSKGWNTKIIENNIIYS